MSKAKSAQAPAAAPRVVIISDLHAHPWSAFATGDGLRNSRLRRSLEVLGTSLQYAADYNLPWLFAGDLVHTAGYALNVVMTEVVHVLRRFPNVQKVAVWGNHDARGVGGLLTLDQTVYPVIQAAVPNFFVLDPSLVQPPFGADVLTLENGLTVAGAGYQPHPKLLTLGRASDIGLYHQTIQGAETPGGYGLREGLPPAALRGRHRLAVVGHVHHAQQIAAPEGEGILIPGSPEHQNFGDQGTHGWWVATVPQGRPSRNPTLEFMPGGSPEFRTVDTPADVAADGHFYRVRSMPAGSVLPANALVVAPTPTAVAQRDVLQAGAQAEQVLQTWMQVKPPPEGIAAEECIAVGRRLLASADPTRLRNMRLTRLRLQDFCSYQDETLDVEPGTWLITGKGRDYPSNGAGKTTLVGEALYWAIFGRTTKDLPAEEVIRWGTSECTVTALLVGDDGSELEVRRRRGSNGHTLEVRERLPLAWEHAAPEPAWEAPSVNEMTAKLQRHLGLTPEIFQNLAYFSQEKLLLFSSATDGERKNVLADLMGLRAYQDASSAANATAATAATVEARAAAQLEVLELEHERAEAECAITAEAAARWEIAHAVEASASAHAVQVLEGDQRAVTTAERAVALAALAAVLVEQCAARVDAQVDARTAAHLAALTVESRERLRMLQERATTTAAVAATGLLSLAAARKEVAKLPTARDLFNTLQQNVTALSKDVEKAAAAWMHARGHASALASAVSTAQGVYEKAAARLSTGMCPTCNQPVDAAHQSQCLAPLSSAVVDAELAAQAAAAARDAAEQHHTASTVKLDGLRGRLTDVQQLIQDLQSRQARLQAADQAAEALAGAEQQERQLAHAARERALEEGKWMAEACRLRQRQRLVRVADYTKRVVQEHAAAVKAATRRHTEVQAQTNPHNTDTAARRVQDLQSRMSLATAMRAEQAMAIAIANYWQAGFSKQGVQSLLVEEIAVRFNAQRGAIFPLLTQGIYDVQFSTLSRTRAGELRERTEFVVYERGQPITYAALSGGQRRRVDIGIMLVLTLAVADWMGVRGLLGLLILDEVFGFLDASGAEGLVAALSQVSAVIPTIYVITHDTQLEALVPNVICIEQGPDGVSALQGR